MNVINYSQGVIEEFARWLVSELAKPDLLLSVRAYLPWLQVVVPRDVRMASIGDETQLSSLLKMVFGVEITLLGGILLNEFAENTELLFIPLQPLGWVLVLSGFVVVVSVILTQEWAGGIIET